MVTLCVICGICQQARACGLTAPSECAACRTINAQFLTTLLDNAYGGFLFSDGSVLLQCAAVNMCVWVLHITSGEIFSESHDFMICRLILDLLLAVVPCMSVLCATMAAAVRHLPVNISQTIFIWYIIICYLVPAACSSCTGGLFKSVMSLSVLCILPSHVSYVVIRESVMHGSCV